MSEVTVSYRVSFRKREGSALVALPQPEARPSPSVEAAPPAGPPRHMTSPTATDAHPTTRLLALAHRIERMLASGELRDYREAATRFGISHARMSQITAMLLLAPAIQADILLGRIEATEGGLRRAVAVADWSDQKRIVGRSSSQ